MISSCQAEIAYIRCKAHPMELPASNPNEKKRSFRRQKKNIAIGKLFDKNINASHKAGLA